jgi:hypothetical protein
MADKSPALPDSRGAFSGYAQSISNNRAKVNPAESTYWGVVLFS